MKETNMQFLMVPCKSVYNGIIGRPFFTTLDITTLTVHLNIKNHKIYDILVIIHVDTSKAHSIHKTLLKGPTVIAFHREREVKRVIIHYHNNQTSTPHILNSGLDKTTMDNECDLPAKTRMKILRPILDGEFIVVQFDKNPTRIVKIGVDVSSLIERDIIKFLKPNVKHFMFSPYEMLGIVPNAACHQFNINPLVIYVA